MILLCRKVRLCVLLVTLFCKQKDNKALKGLSCARGHKPCTKESIALLLLLTICRFCVTSQRTFRTFQTLSWPVWSFVLAYI